MPAAHRSKNSEENQAWLNFSLWPTALICLILQLNHLAAVFGFHFSHHIRPTRKAETLEGIKPKKKSLQHFRPFCSLNCTWSLLVLRGLGLSKAKAGSKVPFGAASQAGAEPTLVSSPAATQHHTLQALCCEPDYGKAKSLRH